MRGLRLEWIGVGMSLVGALLTAGCMTVGPDYAAPTPPTPEAWQAPAGDSAETLEEWWKVFKDPALESLVEDVRAGNRDLAAAAARMDAYAASYGMARADYYPAGGKDGPFPAR